MIEIDGDEFRWTVSGLDRIAIALPWPKARPQWRAPLPAFSELKKSRAAAD